jgi:replicative DNA helicase
MTAHAQNGANTSAPPLATLYDARTERALASALLVHPDLLEVLDPEFDTHKLFDMYAKFAIEAVVNVRHRGEPVDAESVRAELVRDEKLGDPSWFEALLRVTPARNERLIAGWSTAVVRLAAARDAAIEVEDEAQRAQAEIDDFALRDVEPAMLGPVAPPAPKLSFELITVSQAIARLAPIARAPIYTTPFPTLNAAIGFGGLLGTQVYSVAAGTGRGKTSFVAEVAEHTAQNRVPVLVSVHELGPEYFVARRAAANLAMSSNNVMRLHDVTIEKIADAFPYEGTIFFLHRPTLRGLRDATDHVAQKFGVAPLLIVDYLQKLADEIAANQIRPDLRMATSAASSTLLEIGERTRAAVLAVSSIGRGKKILSRPRKLDPYDLVEVAKESGAIEYDGGGVIVLSLSKDKDGDEDIATITLAKARFGRAVHIDARYHGARGSWRDVGEVSADDESQETTSRTTRVEPAKAEPIEDRDDHVRAAILKELRRGPADNKTSLKIRVRGCRKDVVAQVIERMLGREIMKVGKQLALSPEGRQVTLDLGADS